MSVRADVVDTGHKYRRAGTIIIHAPIQKIFDIIADPYRHHEFDGSGTVTACTFGPQRRPFFASVDNGILRLDR